VSCYELGRQPLAVASAAAFLERAGFAVRAIDLAVEPIDGLFDGPTDGRPRLVALSVPMHTALHVGVRAAARIRRELPEAHLCFFGLYAVLHAEHLLGAVADSVVGGEIEGPLVDLARALAAGGSASDVAGVATPGFPARPHRARLAFPVPSRGGLPPLTRYAHLAIDDTERPAAAVEASRGCLHHCRHCPIPPVYDGRFFVVPREVVLEDVRRLVAAGVEHVTFADPDFFNGPGHVMSIVRALHREFPALTFDVTTKIENLLRRRALLPELAACGCAFVVSAVESLSDEVLRQLAKGHTRADVFEAERLLRDVGVPLRPSLVPFTPWAGLDDYLELLDWIDRDGLVHHVDPVQLSIRLLVPPGSLLERADAMRPYLERLDRAAFTWTWTHPDARMDRLHREVSGIVADAARRHEDAGLAYGRILDAALAAAGRPTGGGRGAFLPARARSRPPRLTEPWFC
jgi:radical SAM superfamily enzyme YgiQ (UPF0313 family)